MGIVYKGLPVIDNGDYQTIFANEIMARRMTDGLINIAFLEDREHAWLTVGRVIRPANAWCFDGYAG